MHVWFVVMTSLVGVDSPDRQYGWYSGDRVNKLSPGGSVHIPRSERESKGCNDIETVRRCTTGEADEFLQSLQQLLDYTEDDVEETFYLNFTVTEENFGATEVLELIPNGMDICVNNSNRQEFVSAYVDYIFNRSVASLFESFFAGFHKVCGGKVLELFQPNELQAMVIGNTNYDWKELEKSTEYKGEYWADHPTIRFFWEVFHDLPLEKKKQFLLFLTGSDRIPILGMKSLKLVIQPTGGGEQYLPVAHTCFNLLDLPKYSRREALRDKLLQAIDHNQGFNLA